MSRKRHNPERRVFRGRSYKKYGERLAVLREQSAGIGDDSDRGLCGRCSKNPAEPEHSCPYDQELGSGQDSCNCCANCEHECAMDI